MTHKAITTCSTITNMGRFCGIRHPIRTHVHERLIKQQLLRASLLLLQGSCGGREG